jgi:hypothetical protein
MDETWFREQYEKDLTNKAKQSWNDYWGWVQTFYKGKTFPPVPGWASREKDIGTKVPDARRELEKTGRVIAAEWAKDNAVRKVSTSDLQAWGKQFSDAARSRDMLLAALAEVETEMKKRGVA